MTHRDSWQIHPWSKSGGLAIVAAQPGAERGRTETWTWKDWKNRSQVFKVCLQLCRPWPPSLGRCGVEVLFDPGWTAVVDSAPRHHGHCSDVWQLRRSFLPMRLAACHEWCHAWCHDAMHGRWTPRHQKLRTLWWNTWGLPKPFWSGIICAFTACTVHRVPCSFEGALLPSFSELRRRRGRLQWLTFTLFALAIDVRQRMRLRLHWPSIFPKATAGNGCHRELLNPLILSCFLFFLTGLEAFTTTSQTTRTSTCYCLYCLLVTLAACLSSWPDFDKTHRKLSWQEYSDNLFRHPFFGAQKSWRFWSHVEVRTLLTRCLGGTLSICPFVAQKTTRRGACGHWAWRCSPLWRTSTGSQRAKNDERGRRSFFFWRFFGFPAFIFGFCDAFRAAVAGDVRCEWLADRSAAVATFFSQCARLETREDNRWKPL